jgi:hypothetical protein
VLLIISEVTNREFTVRILGLQAAQASAKNRQLLINTRKPFILLKNKQRLDF